MRVFNQFFSRYLVEKKGGGTNGEDFHLKTDGSWTDDYFVDGSAQQMERTLFSHIGCRSGQKIIQLPEEERGEKWHTL